MGNPRPDRRSGARPPAPGPVPEHPGPVRLRHGRQGLRRHAATIQRVRPTQMSGTRARSISSRATSSGSAWTPLGGSRRSSPPRSRCSTSSGRPSRLRWAAPSEWSMAAGTAAWSRSSARAADLHILAESMHVEILDPDATGAARSCSQTSIHMPSRSSATGPVTSGRSTRPLARAAAVCRSCEASRDGAPISSSRPRGRVLHALSAIYMLREIPGCARVPGGAGRPGPPARGASFPRRAFGEAEKRRHPGPVLPRFGSGYPRELRGARGDLPDRGREVPLCRVTGRAGGPRAADATATLKERSRMIDLRPRSVSSGPDTSVCLLPPSWRKPASDVTGYDTNDDFVVASEHHAARWASRRRGWPSSWTKNLHNRPHLDLDAARAGRTSTSSRWALPSRRGPSSPISTGSASRCSGIAPGFGEDPLVVLRSTVSIGTTRKIVLPEIRRHAAALRARLLPGADHRGRAIPEMRSLPQIIGRPRRAERGPRRGAVPPHHREDRPRVLPRGGRDDQAHQQHLSRPDVRLRQRGRPDRRAAWGCPRGEMIHAANVDYPRSNVARPGFVGARASRRTRSS